jgi:cytochrome P450
LQKELTTYIPDVNARDAFSFPKLESLQYLRGVIREGLRLSHGVTARMPRLVPYPLEFEDWVIPPWTPVSMTVHDVHFDPEVYPEPLEFKPERWIGNPKAPDGESLEKYWVVFGKGPRMCLGIK